MSDDVVRAAGGIVYRTGADGVEVLLVHRPKYDDWSFPKGKLDAGEAEQAAALREVEEETGFRCRLGDDVGVRSYVDARGRDKTVRYWTMSVVDGQFVANAEVDVVVWLPVVDAIGRLTHSGDADLLTEARSVLGSDRH